MSFRKCKINFQKTGKILRMLRKIPERLEKILEVKNCPPKFKNLERCQNFLGGYEIFLSARKKSENFLAERKKFRNVRKCKENFEEVRENSRGLKKISEWKKRPGSLLQPRKNSGMSNNIKKKS